MKPLGIAIVGCGNIFERGYLPALDDPRVSGAARVLAVCDQDGARAERARERTAADLATTSLAEAIARDGVDAVFVLTPTHTHANIAIAALEAGRHVLCEKPIARSSHDGRRMLAAEHASGRRLFVAQTRRFDDRWRAIRDQIATRRIGELVYLFRSEHAWNGAPAQAWQWQNEQSGGALWDVGVHGADLFAWFFGTPPVSVWARRLDVRPESRAGGAPDGAVLAFDFGPRKSAILSLSWFHPPGWGSFYSSMEVVGADGRIDFNDREAHSLAVVDGGLELPRDSPLLSSMAGSFACELNHFLDAVDRGTPFEVTTPDAIAAVRILEAAERSFASGQAEPVEASA